MKKILLTAVFISVILLGAMADTQSVHLASAQNTYVMINEEGCIVPSTAPIQRDGNLYTLIGDVEEITIERSDITLDGNGHTVSQPFVAEGVILHSVKNVTVKNLIVKGGMYGIFLRQASNITLSNNTVTETSVPFPQNMGTGGICVSGGGNNVIVGNRLENNLHGIDLVDTVEGNTIRENNIIGNSEGMRFRNSSGNIIYNNNFVNNKFQVIDFDAMSAPSINTLDNGVVGNYWSDYNGTDADGDGIGDTPYAIDANNVDYYPLVSPYTVATPQTPTPETPRELQPFPVALVATASGVSVAVIGVGLLFYFKKRKH